MRYTLILDEPIKLGTARQNATAAAMAHDALWHPQVTPRSVPVFSVNDDLTTLPREERAAYYESANGRAFLKMLVEKRQSFSAGALEVKGDALSHAIIQAAYASRKMWREWGEPARADEAPIVGWFIARKTTKCPPSRARCGEVLFRTAFLAGTDK